MRELETKTSAVTDYYRSELNRYVGETWAKIDEHKKHLDTFIAISAITHDLRMDDNLTRGMSFGRPEYRTDYLVQAKTNELRRLEQVVSTEFPDMSRAEVQNYLDMVLGYIGRTKVSSD
jgi:hypothetical protein